MSQKTPREVYENQREKLDSLVSDGKVSEAGADAIIELAGAYDADNIRLNPPKGEQTLANSSLSNYVRTLRMAAVRLDLLDTDTETVNDLVVEWHKDVATTTLKIRASALKKFYRFHRVESVEPDEIVTPNGDDPGGTFDPEDIMTGDELIEVVQATDNPRDRMITSVLAWTGMRNGCIRALKWGNIDLEADEWTVPDEADGLKGIEKRGNRRPLLGAAEALREWRNYHVDPSPENYVVTAKSSHHSHDPTTRTDQSTVRRATHTAVEAAGLDKPGNPHMFRHAAVTMWRRRFGMDDGDIKWLLGHAKNSNVMQTTYSHLNDSDRIESVREATGDAEETETGPATPAKCSTCATPLPDGARVCPGGCGTTFDPTVQRQQQAAQSAAWDARAGGPADAANAIRNLADNPEAIAQAPSEVADALNDLADALNE